MEPSGPSPREERLLAAIFERAFMRGIQHAPQDPAPAEWGAEPFGVVRRAGGILAALHFPQKDAKGIVLFGHPGIAPGKGYFHRSDRIPFVRSLGLAAATFDHGGFGESDGMAGLFHRDWADMLAWARRRYPDLPVHLWGVSVGGYFAHHALAQDEQGIASAVFEQVSPDLLRYGDSASLRAASALTMLLMGDARRWSAAEAHAPRMAVEHVLYVSGELDSGVPPDHAARLAAAAGPFARHHAVKDAEHLEAWKKGGESLRKTVESLLLS